MKSTSSPDYDRLVFCGIRDSFSQRYALSVLFSTISAPIGTACLQVSLAFYATVTLEYVGHRGLIIQCLLCFFTKWNINTTDRRSEDSFQTIKN